MGRAIAVISSSAVSLLPPFAQFKPALIGLWRDLFDGYRPELHYMRGPGPKWRAKHGLPQG
jgi:hypothetical protein